MRSLRILVVLCAVITVMTPISAIAQTCTGCPYAYSSLGTLSFDSATYEQHGKPPSGNSGSDMWTMSWASDGNIYATWGDGQGWNQSIAYGAVGVTRITNNPPSLTATDVMTDSHREWKILAFVAGASGVMRGFFDTDTDNHDGSWVASSTNNGTTWSDPSTKIFGMAIDGMKTLGMAQADQAYATLPAGLSTSYYYILLSTQGSQGGGGQDIYLARVPVASWDTKASYEYFSGSVASPAWSSTITNKVSIFHDPNGMEYQLSLVWWPALDAGNGRWILSKFQQTSSLGIFEAPTPWGPWSTLYYGSFRDSYWKHAPAMPQKWMNDCTTACTMWLAWSGWPEYDNINFIKGTLTALDSVAPGIPTNLQTTTVSTTRIDLAWTAPSVNADGSTLDLTGYRISYCDATAVPGCTPAIVITPDLGVVTSYQHTSGLTAGTFYRYSIKARDAAGNLSSVSEVVNGATASEETLTMSATSTPNNWTNTGGATKMASVLTNDSATTYIASGTTSGTQQQFAITNPAVLTSADTILNVRLRVWARKIVTNAVGVVITAVLGANTLTSTCTMTTQNIWQECLFDMATKPGTGAWTLTDVQNLEVRVQNNAARVIQATLIEAVVSFIPDPAPKPPSNVSAVAASSTSVDLTWTVPTQNADGSTLSDLAGFRISYCEGQSCVPAAGATDISPDLSAGTTSYTHTGRTPETRLWYIVRAKDSTGKLSTNSSYVYATPSTNPPVMVQHDWRFHAPGLAAIVPLAADHATYRVRQDGGVRLRLQISNTGTSTTRTYPLACNKDGGSFQDLTDSCAGFGVCIRSHGGVLDGATTAQTFTLPGVLTFAVAGGKFIEDATWPNVGLDHNEVTELEYDLGLTGLSAGVVVCCRVGGMDGVDTPPGDACLTVYAGSASR